jgi:hypothetical protein
MNQKPRTKDESYILCLYEAARASGDITTRLNRYEIGKRAGLHPRGVNAICKLLLRTNFLKKSGEEDVYLTPHGENLALRLLSE